MQHRLASASRALLRRAKSTAAAPAHEAASVVGIYSDEHMAMRASLRTLIDREINPRVDEWEAAGIWPAHEICKKLGDAGFLGLTKPVEYGGSGLDYTWSVAMAEEMGNVRCGGVPMAVGVVTDMATPALAKHGSARVKDEFLRPTILGERVPCLGVSEVGAGSDVAAIRTTAATRGDDFVINGGKMWITNGAQADWMCLLANTNADGATPAHARKTLICVPMDAAGVKVERTLDKLGMRCSDTAQIFFDDVVVPRAYAIGEEGRGFAYQMGQFQEERLFCGASALASLENCIDETVEYARARAVFGKPLLANQAVHFRLAELKTELEALRALTYRAVELYVAGHDALELASMVKLKAGRLSREVADGCLQYWGGMGFMSETNVSRLYRDSRLTSIGGGADEVMLSIISKCMGTLPK